MGTITLTRREKEIADLLVMELTNKEIADRLGIAIRTVDNHVASLIVKCHAKTRTGVVAEVLREQVGKTT